jgi:hypothetical protein
VIDASFPADYKKRAVRLAYLDQIAARATWAAECGTRYVYLASTSSLPPVTSIYGEVKRTAEQAVLRQSGRLLRAGLVISATDPGGRYGQMAGIVRRLPVLMLPAPSEFPLFVTNLTDLLSDIGLVTTGPWPAADRWVTGTQQSSLADVLAKLARPHQPVVSLGPGASRVAARLARNVHFGPLDSLASIAEQSQRDLPPDEGAE